MRVAVMFDGTWNTPSDHTNVYRLKRAIADIGPEGTRQIIWYHEGVGTSWHGRLLGGAFGYGLSEIIRAAFQWLCENFKPSDELYVLGRAPIEKLTADQLGLRHRPGRRAEAKGLNRAGHQMSR